MKLDFCRMLDSLRICMFFSSVLGGQPIIDKLPIELFSLIMNAK